MRALAFIGRGFGIVAAAGVLCACSVTSIPSDAGSGTNSSQPLNNNKTFFYTGKKQKFVVPAGVTQLTVVARGGQGGGTYIYPSEDAPGYPARVYAVIPVQPGEKLVVRVGGSGAHGGFNGGGMGAGSGTYAGNVGGGASDVRAGGDSLANRIIVAAGGGGAGIAVDAYSFGFGGNGGGVAGKTGGNGPAYGDGKGGAGGSQSEGGAGGAGGQDYSRSYLGGDPGSAGALGVGGAGGKAASYPFSGNGGGGGGGYYGGGGGGGGAGNYSDRYDGDGGGGGGGSSYVESSAIKSRMWNGWKREGDGLVVFSWN